MRTSLLLPRSRPSQLGALSPLARMVWDRGARGRFESDEVPDEDLQTILTLAGQAPSGANVQPWRFVVVRNQVQRDRLSRAVYDQAAVAEAPVVVVAYGQRDLWLESATRVTEPNCCAAPENASVAAEARSLDSSEESKITVWLTRHIMVAFSYLMIAAEALGWNTAPMEKYDPAAVRAVLDLPQDAVVVAILAIGRIREDDAAVPSRLPLTQVVWAERHGVSWSDSTGVPV